MAGTNSDLTVSVIDYTKAFYKVKLAEIKIIIMVENVDTEGKDLSIIRTYSGNIN